MLQRNGLYCAVTALAVISIMALAMPVPVYAQSNVAARIPIEPTEGTPDEFGQVLVVRDGNDIVIYGLAYSVPPLSQVTIEADGQEFFHTATFTGQFPIVNGEPIHITDGVDLDTATLTAIGSDGVEMTGTINLNLDSPQIIDRLQTYLNETRKVLDGDQTNVEGGIPAHRLLDIVAIDPDDQPLLGKVLLTQRFGGAAERAFLIDQYEGLSDGNISTMMRSFPPFSQIEVFPGDIDIDDYDTTRRHHNMENVFFHQGEFMSNGTFFPFSTADVGSYTEEELKANSSLLFRITAGQIPGEDGDPPKVFWARVNNDVTVAFEEDPVVTNNNTQDNPDAPGAEGLARIQGQTTDPYSIITVYAENDTSSDVIATATATNSGSFDMIIPSVFDEDGLYTLRQQVYLDVLDPFSNEIEELAEIQTDTESVVFETPTAVPQSDGTFQVEGVVEPAALVIITGRNADGLEFHSGQTTAEEDGSFSVNVPGASEYIVQAMDQAGNYSDSITVSGDDTAIDPFNLVATSDFPNIRITGETESNADVLIFAFPLDQVPDTTETTPSQPENSFYLTSTQADEDGEFSVLIPGGVSRIVYLQAVDPTGNTSNFVGLELGDPDDPISRGLVEFDNLSIFNNPAGTYDLLDATTVSADTGNPVSEVYVAAFREVLTESQTAVPFVGVLVEPFMVNDDGTFEMEIPEYDPVTDEFIEEFYLVALELADEGSYRDVGIRRITPEDGLDRQGPEFGLTPHRSDIILNEVGPGESDTLSVQRILRPGLGNNSIPDDAIPHVFVVVDSNDDEEIDVTSQDVEILGFGSLYSQVGVPFPGTVPIDLGDNHWDPESQSVVGHENVFVTLMDDLGNLSRKPIRVKLDVRIQDPDESLITANGNSVFGAPSSVESNAHVSVYETADKVNLLGSTQADQNGTFFISLEIQEDYVYISTRDEAGNQSSTLKVKVSEPLRSSEFIILDGFGILHTSSSELSAGFLESDAARALAVVETRDASATVKIRENSPLYVLVDDGSILKLGDTGKRPIEEELISIPGKYARDLEVVSSDPFAGYVLLGNGIVVPFGDVPFYGDMVSLQRGYTTNARYRIPGSQLLFDDTIEQDGEFTTEDKNGNGVLDIVVGPGGELVVNEDLNGNGQLDTEPIINPEVLAQGFEQDIARDIELVRDIDDNILGYVLLDGYGSMWAFGDDINGDVVRVEETSGISDEDVFQAFELIVSEEGQIEDFITLNGFGRIFGLPGGPLGAGAADDQENTGHLSFKFDAPSFSFDIARDIRISPSDTNEDGVIDWKDGYYILNGYGGINAIGGAVEIEDTPFLGLDIARDLEFGLEPPR